MTSPDLIHELRASRPLAPASVRATVRETAARETAGRRRPMLPLPSRQLALVALPAAAALAIATAGVLGVTRSNGDYAAQRDQAATQPAEGLATTDELSPPATKGAVPDATTTATDRAGSTTDRAQRVTAALTVEVTDSDAVASSAQEALDVTRSLGGHVVNASVTTGEGANASLTVRIPVAKVQEAIVRFSSLGEIVSQQVSIDDLQEGLDALERRARSVRAQIVRIGARLDSKSLDAETRAVLEQRRRTLRSELRELRRGIASTTAEARMATMQLAVVTPDALGSATVPSRLDRTLDESLNVLLWEGVIVLAVLIVAAPFALLAVVAFLGRRLYRRREEDRLLAT